MHAHDTATASDCKNAVQLQLIDRKYVAVLLQLPPHRTQMLVAGCRIFRSRTLAAFMKRGTIPPKKRGRMQLQKQKQKITRHRIRVFIIKNSLFSTAKANCKENTAGQQVVDT